jgi:hypothetical protein
MEFRRSLLRRPASSRPVIEFLCRDEDRGVIPEPVPARNALPDWYRRLPGVDRSALSATNDGVTVKRCLPFLDAMTAGWILPVAATVRLQIHDDGKAVDAGWEFDRTMVSNHGPFQVAGNPYEPRPPMKFHNYWTIRTAPGWSCLFLPPLNRPNPVFEVLSGLVDTDRFANEINFPFVAVAHDGVHVVEQGTPLVQVIPFRRADPAARADIRSESEAERIERTRSHRAISSSGGWYRRNARADR